MLEKNNYYPGQKSQEAIVLFIRRHWFAYIKWALLFFILTVVIIILYASNIITITDGNKYFFVLGTSACFLFLLALFLTTWTEFYLNVTIITREHLIHIRQSELFTRSVAEQSLLRVQDVNSKISGFFQTFFRFGTVYVETAGEEPNFTIVDIPKPHIVASTIIQIHEELIGEKQKQGVVDKAGEIQIKTDTPKKVKNIPKPIDSNNTKIISIQKPNETNEQNIIKNKSAIKKDTKYDKIIKEDVPTKKPEIKTVSNPAIKSIPKPIIKPIIKPIAKPIAKPKIKSSAPATDIFEIKEGEEIKF